MTIEEMLLSPQIFDRAYADWCADHLVKLSDKELIELIRQAFTIAAARMSNAAGRTEVATLEVHYHAMKRAIEAFKESTLECERRTYGDGS